jgi:(p)ppGpp synthase/HD superfamily hydrolase
MGNLEKKAKQWATFWHTGQVRKYTGKPYIQHPAAVAHLVKTVPHTEEMVAAAWLHDVLEDTACDPVDLRMQLGKEVFALVRWLTDVSKPHQGNLATRKKIDREHLAWAPPEAKTVKLADLIDNSRSIVKFDPDFAVVYLAEKRLLLDTALKEGDTTLWHMADEIVRSNE